jgi:thiamine-monophosphate kinase
MRLIDEIAENRLLTRWAALLPRHPRQVGGIHEADAELLPLSRGLLLAVTVDTVDEEVRLGLYRSPFTAGRTAAVAALSDLAAVGAEPLGLLLSTGLPRDGFSQIQAEVARGVAQVCRRAGTFVLGGDTNETERLSVTCVAVGRVARGRALMRVGMRAGDELFVSGPLGLGSALAAARWLAVPPNIFDESDYRPATRLSEGRALRGIASACMDTSDGLLATLDQLARLNEVAIRVERPLSELIHVRAEAVRSKCGLSALAYLAGQHGEFELVFSVPPARRATLLRRAWRIGWMPLAIGRAERGNGIFVGQRRIDAAGLRNLLADSGGDVAACLRALEAVED